MEHQLEGSKLKLYIKIKKCLIIKSTFILQTMPNKHTNHVSIFFYCFPTRIFHKMFLNIYHLFLIPPKLCQFPAVKNTSILWANLSLDAICHYSIINRLLRPCPQVWVCIRNWFSCTSKCTILFFGNQLDINHNKKCKCLCSYTA